MSTIRSDSEIGKGRINTELTTLKMVVLAAIQRVRVMIAVMENHQQADGSIRVPDALLPYLHGMTEIRC